MALRGSHDVREDGGGGRGPPSHPRAAATARWTRYARIALDNRAVLVTIAVLVALTVVPMLLARGSRTHLQDGHRPAGLLHAWRSGVHDAYWAAITPVYNYLWARVERRKQAMPKYRLPAHMNRTLPVLVMTLPRFLDRSQEMAKCMAKYNATYNVLWGTDGKQPLPKALVDLYAGSRLAAELERHDAHWTMVMANLLSTVQALHEMVARQYAAAVLLEGEH